MSEEGTTDPAPESPPDTPAQLRRKEDLAKLRRLRVLVDRKRTRRSKWSAEELQELPRLYRHACSVVARLESAGESARVVAEARRLLRLAHEILHRENHGGFLGVLRGAWYLFFVASPRTIRREWRLLFASFSLKYGIAIAAFLAVSHDLDLAYSLFDAGMVESEIEQLCDTRPGEPFRGNFTFGIGESPTTAGWIMVHNMFVGILYFTSALLTPFYLFILALNGSMLGTYTAVAGHWGQAGSISSILWCHGVIEIQTFVLAGTAGLVLVRALLRPGPWTRRRALALESRTALRLMAPVFPLLFVAGLIEGFVSPHAPTDIRIAVAILSGIALLAWALLGGRGKRSEVDGHPGGPT